MMIMPKGFPLKPIDCNGEVVKESDYVIVKTIPESLIHDMNEELKSYIKSCEGRVMEITEIDSYGFLWLELITLETTNEYQCEKFSLEPKYVQKQKDS